MYICNIKYIYNIISKSKQYVYNFFQQKFIQIDIYVFYKSVYERDDCINNTIYLYILWFFLTNSILCALCVIDMESDRIDWTGVYIYCTGGEGPPEISFKMKKKKKDWLVMKTKVHLRSSILSLIKTIHYCFLKIACV